MFARRVILLQYALGSPCGGSRSKAGLSAHTSAASSASRSKAGLSAHTQATSSTSRGKLDFLPSAKTHSWATLSNSKLSQSNCTAPAICWPGTGYSRTQSPHFTTCSNPKLGHLRALAFQKLQKHSWTACLYPSLQFHLKEQSWTFCRYSSRQFHLKEQSWTFCVYSSRQFHRKGQIGLSA